MSTGYSKKDLMKLAIEEHLNCKEFPRVGAAIAKDGELLATGHRGERVGVHAERAAIEKLTTEQLKGASLFTTLEPCVALNEGQPVDSCADLIIASGIKEVVIGVLDPNGTIYTQGFRKLLQSGLNVSFFSRSLQKAVEEETFEYGDFHIIYRHGKRRIPVVHGGTSLNILFSDKDNRSINIRWTSLQFEHGCVDLISENGAVRVASGARKFEDITDPMVFRFPSYFARMEVNSITVVKPPGATFCVLVQLLAIYANDILFQWEVRND